MNMLGKVAYIIMGEAEGCSYMEKKLVGIVLWNRIKTTKYRFNSIEKDFHGWQLDRRQIDKIDTEEERQAFIDSVNAAYESYKESAENPNLFFFHIGTHKPSSWHKTKQIFTGNTQHNFYEIVD